MPDSRPGESLATGAVAGEVSAAGTGANQAGPRGPGLRSFPMLSVESLAASLRFYEQLLGAERNYQFPDQGEPVFVTLRFGASEVGLGQLGSGPALHGQAQRPATGHRIELCLYVSQLDRVVAALAAAQVPVLLEPTAQPWGERVAYVSDPDGNLVMLVE